MFVQDADDLCRHLHNSNKQCAEKPPASDMEQDGQQQDREGDLQRVHVGGWCAGAVMREIRERRAKRIRAGCL